MLRPSGTGGARDYLRHRAGRGHQRVSFGLSWYVQLFLEEEDDVDLSKNT